MRIGEAFVGEGPNAAHVNVLLGPKDGPVGAAFAASLAAPRMGYIPFLAVIAPNVTPKPATLFVAKADLRGEVHETMTWGPAQAGIAAGVQDATADGVLPREVAEDWVAIAAVWVAWAADDAEAVFANNRAAARAACERAMAGGTPVEAANAARMQPHNPFFTPGS